jgi:hypothetical protein
MTTPINKAKRTKILMCPPDYFEVDYAINPWMIGNENNLDVDLAKVPSNNLPMLKLCLL